MNNPILTLAAILPAFFLFRAFYILIVGRKHVEFSYLKPSFVTNLSIGVVLIPLILTNHYLSRKAVNEYVEKASVSKSLEGDYSLVGEKGGGKLSISNSYDSFVKNISIQYPAKKTEITGTASLKVDENNSIVSINIDGIMTERKKRNKYNHNFDCEIKSDTLILKSVTENILIVAVRKK